MSEFAAQWIRVDLYVMRHGEAASAEQDPRRPLTEAGREAIERVARRAATARVQPEAIYHSGILRAEQTAEILARHLGVPERVQARDGLRPDDAVEPVARWLLEQSDAERGFALVGHLPFVDRLASLFLLGDAQAKVLSFQAGTLVKLTSGRTRFIVSWMLSPDVA